ncbi:MAG: NADP(H)-dependent aldo-keto reductase [Chitinophagales bacterium]
MEYRNLGNTDLKVSVICLGTMTFGEQNSEAEAHEQLNYAFEQGVNFIDTAELYAVPSTAENSGLTEKYIGTWLKKRSDREKIVIGTKIAGPSSGLKYLRNPLRFNKEQITEAINGSLQRMQTDYVDLYQLHWPERPTNYFGNRGYKHNDNHWWQDNMLEVLEAMNDLVKEGKVRHFGISNETPWGLMRFLNLADKHDLCRCVSIQNPYSLLNRLFEVGLSEIAIREKAGLLAYSPMGFGLLSGKYHRGEKPTNTRLSLFKQMSRYSNDNCYNATAEYVKIADKHNISMAQMSLAFINQQKFLTSNIIGARTMEQLKENIDSINLKLSPDILKEIGKVHEAIPNPAP